MLNWVSMPATQVSGTVFNSLDDEKVIETIDFNDFEEKFKTLGRNSLMLKNKGSPSTPTKSIKSNAEGTDSAKLEPTMLDAKRIQNVAIARKKVTASCEKLSKYIAVLVNNSY